MSSIEAPRPAYDHFIKMIIIGNSGVGKTNILMRFCDEKYKESHVATVGVDFKIKTIVVNDKRIKLQMWDTAGQERYRNLTNNYYKGAAGIVLTYAIDNRKSFEDIGRFFVVIVEVWIKQINENTTHGTQKLLVASKSDLAADRMITEG
jgi:small GTP-binding protein